MCGVSGYVVALQLLRTSKEHCDGPCDVSGVGEVCLPQHRPQHPQRVQQRAEVKESGEEDDRTATALEDCARRVSESERGQT